jgi:NADH-quinone oxidoreductase subunit F
MLDVCDNILGRSFCALGDGAASPIMSGIKYFRQEFLDLCAKQPSHGRPGQQINSGQPINLAGSHR